MMDRIRGPHVVRLLRDSTKVTKNAGFCNIGARFGQ